MGRNKHSDERHLEFGGVIGASLLVFVLPITIMAINIACNRVFIILHIGVIDHICLFVCVTILSVLQNVVTLKAFTSIYRMCLSDKNIEVIRF